MKHILLILLLGLGLSCFAQEKKITSISKQEILKLPLLPFDSNFSISRYSPYDNGKLKITVIIKCDLIHKLILKKYGYFSFTIINPNNDDEKEKIKIDSNLTFTVYKPYDKNVSFTIELKGIYSINTRQQLIITDNNQREFIIPYKIDCEDNLKLINNNCPKCQKSKNVIMQTFGYPEFEDDEVKHHDGNFIILKNGVEIFLGGCKIYNCQKIWYCKRCKLEF